MHAYAFMLVAVSSLVVSVPAFAAEEPDVASVHVSMAGLDLASPGGAATAYRRIRNAAVAVCGESPDVREFDRREAYDRCVQTAVDGAVARLDKPALSQLAGKWAAPMVLAAR